MEGFARRLKIQARPGQWSDWVRFETTGAGTTYLVRATQDGQSGHVLGQVRYYEPTGFHATRQFEGETLVHAAPKWGGMDIQVYPAQSGGRTASGGRSSGGADVTVELIVSP